MSIIKLILLFWVVFIIVALSLMFIPPYVQWFLPINSVIDVVFCVFGGLLIFALIVLGVMFLFGWWIFGWDIVC